jgi:peptide deformylase
MAILKILQYPDKRLSRVAIPVTNFDSTLHQVVADMFETHYSTPHCAALAATQLDLPIAWSITVIDFSEKRDHPLCLINPVIIDTQGEQIEYEGCMSVYPNFIQEKVKRPMKLTVKAQDKEGISFELTAEGFLAKCIQHEVDHLNGKLYLTRLPQFKLERIHRKIKKHERARKEE